VNAGNKKKCIVDLGKAKDKGLAVYSCGQIGMSLQVFWDSNTEMVYIATFHDVRYLHCHVDIAPVPGTGPDWPNVTVKRK
jgi:hypothetical protein